MVIGFFPACRAQALGFKCPLGTSQSKSSETSKD